MILRVIELFAGIGSQAQALKNLGIPFESTVCEIDDHAYRMYCAIHGDTVNLGDITEIQHLPDCDLITYSFPCQDLSIAGHQKGMSEGSGTRSSLLWEVGRLLRDMRERETLPLTLLMENVDAILNRKNIDNFNRWIGELNMLGYTSSFAVMNAKDYGIPQNRKRCFMVSRLDGKKFVFPKPVKLEIRLKDVLDKNVDESYYLSDERIAKYEQHRERHELIGDNYGWRPITLDGVSNTVLTHLSKDRTQTVIIQGHLSDKTSDADELKLKGMLNIPGLFDCIQRVYGGEGISPTITAGHEVPKIEEEQ